MIKKGKGTYQHKKDKDHKVFVYDITHCVDDDKTYYSYSDPLDARYLSSAENIFLEKFVFVDTTDGLEHYGVKGMKLITKCFPRRNNYDGK